MRVELEGGLSSWLAAALALDRRRERAALLALIDEVERRLARLRAEYESLDVPVPILEALHRLLGDATGRIPAADLWAALGRPFGWQRSQRDNFELGQAMRRLGWSRTMQRFDREPRSAY